MLRAVNLQHCFENFHDTWSPKIVGELNGQHVKLAKLEGEKCPWHAHQNEDELFLVIQGALDIHTRKGVVVLEQGEFYIVPRDQEHRVVPRGLAKILLFEPTTTAHTGHVRSAITVEHFDRLRI